MKTHERLKCADRFEPRVDGRDPSGAEHPAEHSAERRFGNVLFFSQTNARAHPPVALPRAAHSIAR